MHAEADGGVAFKALQWIFVDVASTKPVASLVSLRITQVYAIATHIAQEGKGEHLE